MSSAPLPWITSPFPGTKTARSFLSLCSGPKYSYRIPKFKFSFLVICQESWKKKLKAFTFTQRSGSPTVIVDPQTDFADWPAGTVQDDTSPAIKSARACAVGSRLEFCRPTQAGVGAAEPHPVSPLQGPAVPSKTNCPVPRR